MTKKPTFALPSTTPPSLPSLSVGTTRIPRAIVCGFREAGIDLSVLCPRVGLEVEALDQRIPTPQAYDLMTLAFAASDDPALGLTLGGIIRPELFGVFGFTAMSAPTYGEALARLSRYKRARCGDVVDLFPCGAITALRVRVTHPESAFARQHVDGELVYPVAFGRTLTGRPITPVQVSITRSRPTYHARHAEIFGCPIVFEARENEILLESADLEVPLLSTNPALFALFEERAEKLLASSSVASDLAARVRAVLQQMMRGALLDLGAVARSLAMSERSLQRKLAHEGVSFQQLVDEVRFSLADDHLRNRAYEVAEVAHLLGFSQPSSFYRAFKRWTGMTPEEYRRGSPDLDVPRSAEDGTLERV